MPIENNAYRGTPVELVASNIEDGAVYMKGAANLVLIPVTASTKSLNLYRMVSSKNNQRAIRFIRYGESGSGIIFNGRKVLYNVIETNVVTSINKYNIDASFVVLDESHDHQSICLPAATNVSLDTFILEVRAGSTFYVTSSYGDQLLSKQILIRNFDVDTKTGLHKLKNYYNQTSFKIRTRDYTNQSSRQALIKKLENLGKKIKDLQAKFPNS